MVGTCERCCIYPKSPDSDYLCDYCLYGVEPETQEEWRYRYENLNGYDHTEDEDISDWSDEDLEGYLKNKEEPAIVPTILYYRIFGADEWSSSKMKVKK